MCFLEENKLEASCNHIAGMQSVYTVKHSLSLGFTSLSQHSTQRPLCSVYSCKEMSPPPLSIPPSLFLSPIFIPFLFTQSLALAVSLPYSYFVQHPPPPPSSVFKSYIMSPSSPHTPKYHVSEAFLHFLARFEMSKELRVRAKKISKQEMRRKRKTYFSAPLAVHGICCTLFP